MSEISGMNQFGNFIINGKKLSFAEVDKNNDGVISQEEYSEALQTTGTDSFEPLFKNLDEPKTISEHAFEILNQKTVMQNLINELAGDISKDFSGKSEYISRITTELKEYLEEFAANYEGELSNMAADFETELTQKYEELKSEILAGDSDTIKSKVLDIIYEKLVTPENIEQPDGTVVPGESVSKTAAKKIATELEAEADRFIKDYKGTNLEADLLAHLEEYMNKSDAEKLSGAVETFRAGVDSLGAMIDNGNDLKQLKEFAKEFLQSALKAGVTMKLAGINIKTEAAITSALNKFQDGDELNEAIEEVIASLNTETLKNSLISEAQNDTPQSDKQDISQTKGSDYQVDALTIDYSKIEGYADNKKIIGKENKVQEQIREVLNNDNLKSQMEAQVKELSEEKGVPYEQIAAIFENVYNQSIEDVINSDILGHPGLPTPFKIKTVGTKECIDEFITRFNTNIAKSINEMNASDKDFDIQDIDYSAINIDENGNESPINTISRGGKTKAIEKAKDNAQEMCTRLKPQLLEKAQAMCKANNKEFDFEDFNAIFNNAMINASEAGISTERTGFLSKVSINTDKLIETFLTEFQTNYTEWVKK